MSVGEPASPRDEGLPIENLQRLVAMGNLREGRVTVDEVLVTLGTPEPTPDFVVAITELLANHNITVDPEEPAPVEIHAPDDVLATASSAAATSTTSARRIARRTRERVAEPQVSSRGGGSSDPVRMYLKEIGRVPLLTADEEVVLAKRVEAGLLARERLEALAGRRRRPRAGPPRPHR